MKKLSTLVPFLPSVAPPALQQPFHQSFYKSECFIHLSIVFLLLLEVSLSHSSSPADKLLQQLPRVCQCLGSLPEDGEGLPVPSSCLCSSWILGHLASTLGVSVFWLSHEVDAVKNENGEGAAGNDFPSCNFFTRKPLFLLHCPSSYCILKA